MLQKKCWVTKWFDAVRKAATLWKYNETSVMRSRETDTSDAGRSTQNSGQSVMFENCKLQTENTTQH